MYFLIREHALRRFLGQLFLLSLCSISPFQTLLASDFKTGKELATAVYNRPDGDNMISVGSMVLIEKGHKPRVRQMFTFNLDEGNGNKLMLIRFKKPADITNTGLLTLDYGNDRETDQWVYLPAINKSRRISTKRKGGRFVGSDILYEDLRDREVNKDTHKILRKEKYNKMDTIVMESIPVDPDNSVYDKKIAWIHPKTLLALKVDIYQNGAKAPVKRVLAKQIEKKQGFWTVMKSVVRDLKSKHETHLQIQRIKYDQNVPKMLFSLKYLEDPQREKEIIKQLSGK